MGQGRKQYIPHAVEATIANQLNDMNSRLFGLSWMEVRKFVFAFVEAEKISHPFKNGLVGKDCVMSPWLLNMFMDGVVREVYSRVAGMWVKMTV